MPRTIRGLATYLIHVFLLISVPFAIAPAFAQTGAAREAQLIRRMADFDSIQMREEVCRSILEGRPADYARHFCEGFLAISAGRDLEADLALNRALDARSDFSLAALIYGEAYEELGKPDLAEKFYRRAIRIHPERTEARFALGHLLFTRGRDEDPGHLADALEEFRLMTETDPASPDGWSNMGLVLTHMERYEDAEVVLKKALERDPTDPFLLDNLGALYARLDRNTEAEHTWRLALAENPGYGPVVIELAALYARTGRLLDALETLEAGRQAVHAPPWGPRVRRNLGFAYMRMEEWERSGEALAQALQSGADALAYLGAGHLKMLKGFTNDALRDFERGASLDTTLALPFIRSWRATLKFAISPGRYPALETVIQITEEQESGALETDLDPMDQAIVDGNTGVRSTPYLAAFVLDEWVFDDVEGVRDFLRSGAGNAVIAAYDTPPEAVTMVQADYPMGAQDAGQGGTVDIRVVIDEEGNVVQTKVENCNAPPSLCRSAELAAEKWKFTPAMRYGRPVRSALTIPFRFTPPGH